MRLDEIKAIPILEVAEGLGIVVKGRSAHCFSHSPDRHPSLVFNPTTNRFRCYVCPDTHGSVIDLVMQVRNCSFKEALDELNPNHFTHNHHNRRFPEPKRQKKNQKVSSPAISLEYKNTIFNTLLDVSPMAPEGLKYLNARGIDTATAESMGVGFLQPEAFCSLYKVMIDLYGRKTLKQCGLSHFFLLAREGLSFLLFPYRHQGRIHLIKARCLLTKKEADLREINRFVATEPAGILYNQDTLSSSTKVYLCEGEIDTLTLLQRGHCAIGIPGVSSFREEWFALLANKHVVLCLDHDAGSKLASEWFEEACDAQGISYSHFDLPLGMDINDYFNQEEAYIGYAQS